MKTINNFWAVLALMLTVFLLLTSNSHAQIGSGNILDDKMRALIKEDCQKSQEISPIMCQCVMERIMSHQSSEDLQFVMNNLHSSSDADIPDSYGKLVDESNAVCSQKLSDNAKPEIKHVTGVDQEVLEAAQEICMSGGNPENLCKCAVNDAIGGMDAGQKKRLSSMIKGGNDPEFGSKLIEALIDAGHACIAHSHYE